jgi:hypothetical protein
MLPFSSTSSAEPEYDLVIESNLRYLFDTGGGEIMITVKGSPAQQIRQDIIEEFILMDIHSATKNGC